MREIVYLFPNLNHHLSMNQKYLTHRDLVTPYGDIDLGQNWLR